MHVFFFPSTFSAVFLSISHVLFHFSCCDFSCLISSVFISVSCLYNFFRLGSFQLQFSNSGFPVALCGYAWDSIHTYQSQGQSKQRLSKLAVFILSTEVLCASKYLNTLSHKTRTRDLLDLSKKRNSPGIARFRDRSLIATFCPLRWKPVDTVDWQVAKKIGSLSFYTKMSRRWPISSLKLKELCRWDFLIINTELKRKDGIFMYSRSLEDCNAEFFVS